MTNFVQGGAGSIIGRDADRLALTVVFYGLLLVVAYRSLVQGEASWELLGLVVLGGMTSAAYRLWRRSMSREEVVAIGATFVVALLIGLFVAVRAAG